MTGPKSERERKKENKRRKLHDALTGVSWRDYKIIYNTFVLEKY